MDGENGSLNASDRADRPSRPLRRTRRGGFTLVETVVVLVILGIMVVSAAPRFLSLQDLDAARAHQQARDDLRYARQLASSSGCPIRVDFTGGGYSIEQRDACRAGAFTRPVVDPSTNVSPFSVVLPGGLTITSSVDPLVFDERGRATNSVGHVADADIQLGTLRLEAVGETGLVRVP